MLNVAGHYSISPASDRYRYYVGVARIWKDWLKLFNEIQVDGHNGFRESILQLGG